MIWASCQNTTSGILSTGIVVQGTWLMLRSIWLFFHFCWLQIIVLKVSSIIIPVHSDALWSHNWRSKAHTNSRLAWPGVFALRNWKLITQRSSVVYNGNHFVHKLPNDTIDYSLNEWYYYISNSVSSIDTCFYSVFHKTQAEVVEASSKAGGMEPSLSPPLHHENKAKYVQNQCSCHFSKISITKTKNIQFHNTE